MYFPGEPVREFQIEVAIFGLFGHRSISRFSMPSCPDPAVLSFSNTLPKVSLTRFPTPPLPLMLGCAFLCTKTARSCAEFNAQKSFAAPLADCRYARFGWHREPPVFALSGSLWANQGLPLTL
jgi:hypothetical protein